MPDHYRDADGDFIDTANVYNQGACGPRPQAPYRACSYGSPLIRKF